MKLYHIISNNVAGYQMKPVLPGCHQNKEHWNMAILDNTISAEETKRMITECYDLITGAKKNGKRKK